MLEAIIGMLAGLGALLIGFKLLSDNIEKLATSGLKKLFNKTSENPWIGVGIGAAVTAIIQSSGASTIMVVGFVNAGLMNLYQATAMIMGANIGTTVTAQIAALGSFDIGLYATLLAFIGAFMNMLCKKEKPKTIGLALSGLGLVFLALGLMSDSMGYFKTGGQLETILQNISNPFLLLFVGIVLTALLQSSSALTSILISMVSAGIMIGTSSSDILFVILGTNIGSTVTALLSSLGASTNAKRASLIHLLFNVFGSIIYFIVLLFWQDFYAVTFEKWFPGAPHTQLAMFHTFFNVSMTLLFIFFIKYFVKIATFIIPDRKEVLYETLIDERFLNTPSVAVMQVSKEVARMGSLAMETLNLSIDGFIKHDYGVKESVQSKIKIIDNMNSNILSYLVKISSSHNTTPEEEKLLSVLHHSINDFYREVEIADNMTKYTRHLVEDPLKFSDKVFEDINTFKEKLNTQFLMVEKLILDYNFALINDIDKLEEEMDKLRSSMIRNHIERLEAGECTPASSGIYVNLVSNLERAGDHLCYVAHNIVDNI